MLKALLIDDEERATDALRLMIEKFIPAIGLVEVCNDARKAAALIHNYQPSIIFLDIRMPHVSGFEVLESIPNKNFKIIFTTAYDEYAIKAIRFSAFDYLLKPIDVEELIFAIDRIVRHDETEMERGLLINVMYNLKTRSNSEFRLALPTREGVHYLYPQDIIRCEALGNYTRFHTSDSRLFLISRTLREYDELLSPYGFIRTHKTHLVNKTYISFIDHDGFIILRDATRIEVSRRRKEEVMAMLKKG